MITTAEGVETEQQRDTVQMLGCTQLQGFQQATPGQGNPRDADFQRGEGPGC
jgi:EAL domain-containing protein (putative c-di-GMP-specific phosphodiesterase class I)